MTTTISTIRAADVQVGDRIHEIFEGAVQQDWTMHVTDVRRNWEDAIEHPDGGRWLVVTGDVHVFLGGDRPKITRTRWEFYSRQRVARVDES